MTARTFVIALVLGLLLSACSHTTVVLLPDEDGKIGAVSVKSKDGAQVVDKAYGTSSVGSLLNDRPSKVETLSPEKVAQTYKDTLRAQPSKPASFILYFVTGTSEITTDSQKLIPKILDTAKRRSPTEISIIGHTDATGSESSNVKLSLERAKAVEKIMRDANKQLGYIDLRYFGEKDPLIKTPKNVAEPRNRRVEIMIL